MHSVVLHLYCIYIYTHKHTFAYMYVKFSNTSRKTISIWRLQFEKEFKSTFFSIGVSKEFTSTEKWKNSRLIAQYTYTDNLPVRWLI